MGLIGGRRERRAERDAAEGADRLFRDGDQLRRSGQYAEAAVLLAEAVRIRAALLGPAAPATAAARLSLARALHQVDRRAEAEIELRTVLDTASARPSRGKVEGHAHLLLGSVLLATDRPQEAVTELETFLDLAERHDFGRLVLLAHDQRALAHGRLGRDAEAAEQYAELAAAWTAEDGPGTARVLEARSFWATHVVRLGHYSVAEAECRQLIRAAAALNPPLDTVDRSARHTLALALIGRDRAAEAEPLLREAIERHRTAAGPDAPAPRLLQLGLARTLNAQQRHEEALSAAETVRGGDTSRPLYGATAVTGLDIATAQLALGRTDEARLTADRALADCHAALGRHHHRALELGTLRGRILAAQGNLVEARAELTANAADWRTHFGADHSLTRAAEQARAALDRR